jgi:hypothetical protein
LIIPVTLCYATTAVGAATEDPYSMQLVESVLRLPSGVSTASLDKQVHRLGDSVSIALIKLYSERELTNPRAVRRYLPLIKESFAHPELIALTQDKDPMVTIFLLNYLRRRVERQELREQISQVLRFVSSKRSPRRENAEGP